MDFNGVNRYLFVKGKEIHKFKAKDPEIVATLLCLGNISKDWTVDNMKKTGFNSYVYEFSVKIKFLGLLKSVFLQDEHFYRL